ncbi:hypothetical protein G6F31_020613 [Rhizopus arrhizus]|nr:hypothetical protein G6F31_020613 [Rhizopus arrhizus]
MRERHRRARLRAGPRLERAGLQRAVARPVRRLAHARPRTEPAALHLHGPGRARTGGGLGPARPPRRGGVSRGRRRAPGRTRGAGPAGLL